MNQDETHRMAHQKTITELTAESYLIGGLSDAEAEAFERHFFDCGVCADTIRAGVAMLAAGREVAKSEVNPATVPLAATPSPSAHVLPFRTRVQQWTSIAAAAVLAFVLGNVFPLLPRTAQAVASIEIASQSDAVFRGIERDESQQSVLHFDGNHPRITQVEIHDLSFSRYSIELRDAHDKVLTSIPFSVEDVRSNEGSLPLLIRPL